jgi:hypothetical protein
MKKILSLLLLQSSSYGLLLTGCSLPVTTFANAPVRRVGTAIVKIIEYLKYTDGKTRSECIASYLMPLLENSSTHKDAARKTIEIDAKKTVDIIIAQARTDTNKAIVLFEECALENDFIKKNTILTIKPIPLDGGYFSQILSGSPSHDYKEIQIRLSNKLEIVEEISDTKEPKDK